jgi:hypothetical protein
MEVLDPLGLNDYHIARHPMADRGKGWVGHELGDGKYILDHKPDILMLANFQSDALFPADQQLVSDPRFASHYQLIHIDVGPPDAMRAGLYLRRIDGPLGIALSPNQETVPAYLAKINDANSVRLIDGKAQLVIAPYGSAQFTAIPLGSGSWKATPTGAGAARLAVHGSPASAACDACAQADSKGMATFTVENTSGEAAVLEVIQLTRP